MKLRIGHVVLLLLGPAFAGPALSAAAPSSVPDDGWPDLGPRASYHDPLREPACLTSSFGEYRPRHFHGGVDFTTGGKEGAEVLAVDDGEVARVKTRVGGLGRALYLRLADGRLAVYGHLAEFREDIEAYVREEQLRRKRYFVDLFPEPGRLTVKRGEVVARSGQTGAGPPHLHLEIRDGDEPLNPLLVGIESQDGLAPLPRFVVVEPLDAESRVDGRFRPASVALTGPDASGVYRLAREPAVRGRVGISVAVTDHEKNCSYRLAPYAADLEVDGRLVYRVRLGRTTFPAGPQAEVTYRYVPAAELAPGSPPPGRLTRLYATSGAAPFRDPNAGDGTIDATLGDGEPDGRRGVVRVNLWDAEGNEARVEGALRMTRVPNAGAPPETPPPGKTEPRLAVETTWIGAHLEVFVKPDRPVLAPHLWWGPADADTKEATRVGKAMEAAPGGWEAVLDPLPGGIPGRLAVEATGSEGYSGGSAADVEPGWLLTRAGGAKITLGDGEAYLDVPPECLFLDVVLRAHPGDDSTALAAAARQGLVLLGRPWTLEPADALLQSLPWFGIRPPEGRSEDPRVGLYTRVEPEGDWSFAGHEFHAGGGWIGARIGGFDTMAVLADTTAPVLGRVTAGPGADWRDRGPARPEIRAVVDEKGSGIDAESVEVTLDGQWIPAEWDPERAIIRYQPPAALGEGAHEITLRLADRAGNRAERVGRFEVPGSLR
jgi:hypothetical protein